MGVPVFFKWLATKYPSIVSDCVEEKPTILPNGDYILPDASKSNPNNVEFHNLYLDMNGIIHGCTHPNDRPAPKNESEMMIAVFDYIDRVFSIVRPRRLLYMAIDGVAPRAKMNQQRSRRFGTSKENREKMAHKAKIIQDLEARGKYAPPQNAHPFDSNCITPGTGFMQRLSTCLHFYVHDRLQNDPGWKNIAVILSDSSVPGEGEHKVMDYIRRQRVQPGHDPNTQHVLCGSDADLIILGLTTHERNFTIIRETFKYKPSPCDICGQFGHKMKNCQGVERGGDAATSSMGSRPNFSFVKLHVLRGLLEGELRITNSSLPFNLDRAIDDWVFLSFFVGNDFLPHLPYLETGKNAIDRLVELYQKVMVNEHGWLTDAGVVNLERLQMIFNELELIEVDAIKKRQPKVGKRRKNKSGSNANQESQHGLPQNDGAAATAPIVSSTDGVIDSATPAEQQLGPSSVPSGSTGGVKRKREEDDAFTIWMDAFKEAYYTKNFDYSQRDDTFRSRIAHEYVRGLCWVLQYYYQGVPSWKWFYAYHYAPFASDFQNISSMGIVFEKNTLPFSPMEQLMSVFPADSSSLLPPAWAKLMLDPNSPIVDFYPADFKIDTTGKKNAWQGVTLLPFVNEERLKSALDPLFGTLTEEEKRRNVRGEDLLFVGKKHAAYNFLRGLDSTEEMATLKPEFVHGISGHVMQSELCVEPEGSLDTPVQSLETINDCHVLCMKYRDPIPADSSFKYPACRSPKQHTVPSFTSSLSFEPQPGLGTVDDTVFIHDDSNGHGEVGGSVAVSTIAITAAKNVIGAFATPMATWTPEQEREFINFVDSELASVGGEQGNLRWGNIQRHFPGSSKTQLRKRWFKVVNMKRDGKH